MKPLIVLLSTFVVAIFAIHIISDNWNFPLAGTIAMSAMLLFTSIAHFAFSKGMELMMPSFFPLKKQLVWLTGIIEMAAAAGLLLTSWKHTTALWLMVFFVLILPANIYAAAKKVDYQKANHEGSGTSYLWFRVPLQILFIAWAYWFSYR